MAGVSGSLILTVCALVLSLLFHLPLLHGKINPEFRLLAVEPQPVFEDGYTVTTVIDGHKLHINPHSVLLRPRSSDLIVLDTSRSSFYTLPFPIAQDGVIKILSGDGVEGYLDGSLGTARFSKPRSFAVDLKGNMYVADKNNHVIRKISDSGITTIAGGYTYAGKPGHTDGPAQNATFSSDFEVTFVAEECALLVSDHGNQLVRQINLKAEDCRSGSSGRGSKSVGGVWFWSVGVFLACLVGFLIGLAVRPYVISNTRGQQQAEGYQRDMEALPNPSGETNSDSLLRHQKRSC